MTVQFNLEYHTRPGQEVFLTGSSEELGNWEPLRAIKLTYQESGNWQTSLRLSEKDSITYRYLIRETNRPDLSETGQIHTLERLANDELILTDQWQEVADDYPFYSSAFTDCIFRSKDIQHASMLTDNTLTIRCFAPALTDTQQLYVCGDSTASGNWNPDLAIPMYRISAYEWETSIKTIPTDNDLLHFKFIVKDTSDTPIYWEYGENRIIRINPGKTAQLAQGYHLRNTQKLWRGAGVAIPVFSLRSSQGYGIGEFTDLLLLIDWAVKTGQQVIQILPINDTTMTHTWQDSYPYNANSIFALHPAYLNLEQAGILPDNKRMEAYRTERTRLNMLPEVDYEQVTAIKWKYAKELYSVQKEAIHQDPDFLQFVEKNRKWLLPYSAFSYLRDKNNTPDFHWWEEYGTFSEAEIAGLCSPGKAEYDEIALYFFVQYHLDKQLRQVSDYARKNGIVLKGDIPIGISRTSADAWMNPQLFHMDCQAGAPPDDFSQNGQNWGFPTYNWEVMKGDQFSWWKERFSKMSDYFDAYRIDHILGFFRIWEIPVKSTLGVMGHFNPALPFTTQEIESFGLWFDYDRMAQPFIRDYFLKDLFGDAIDEVKNNYLYQPSQGAYALKKEFDTQLEISNYFEGQTDERSLRIRDGLLKLAAEVLFIPEYEENAGTGKYHPRISARETRSYQALNDSQKQAYDELYNNFFFRRHNQYWCDQAYTKLPSLLGSTRMLACGEDLGMIPKGVEEVMKNLRILSLEIQRMPKKEGILYDNPATYPYLSVCTTSTHDMSTLREWWNEYPANSQIYYNEILHREGTKPDTCTADLCEQIVRQHLHSPAMLTILPWQDWIAINEQLRRKNPSEERINIPAIARHYWRYRMHIPLEELINQEELNRQISSLIRESGR